MLSTAGKEGRFLSGNVLSRTVHWLEFLFLPFFLIFNFNCSFDFFFFSLYSFFYFFLFLFFDFFYFFPKSFSSNLCLSHTFPYFFFLKNLVARTPGWGVLTDLKSRSGGGLSWSRLQARCVECLFISTFFFTIYIHSFILLLWIYLFILLFTYYLHILHFLIASLCINLFICPHIIRKFFYLRLY